MKYRDKVEKDFQPLGEPKKDKKASKPKITKHDRLSRVLEKEAHDKKFKK